MLKSVINDLIGSYNAYKDREAAYNDALTAKSEEMNTSIIELFDEVPLDPFEISLEGRKYIISRKGIEGMPLTLKEWENLEIVLSGKLKGFIEIYQNKYVPEKVEELREISLGDTAELY